jgi:hypothetical protein
MAVSSTNTYTGKGIAESFEDVIFDISPEDTPLLSLAKRMSAGQTYHQWQTDALAAAATNRTIEGDDASFATLASTTVLGNYTQISRKTVQISGTYDVVKKYGRKSEVAYQLMKGGKELKRDMEFAIVRNQASSAGGAGTARSTGGVESWIVNRVLPTGNTTGTTPGFANGAVASPTDGTLGTFVEADLKSALQLAWADGGEPSLILMSAKNKALFSSFAGIATKFSDVRGTNQATITGAADIYVSDYGNHTVKLDRFMRDEVVLCVDPGYVGIATLRPMEKVELAKTGDATNYLIQTEYALVVQNPNAHAKVQSVGA